MKSLLIPFFLVFALVASVYLVRQSTRLASKASIVNPDFYTYAFAKNTTPLYARGKQLSPGVYDPVSDQTFMVYDSGRNTGGISSTSPYIIVYNHQKHTWSSEIKIGNAPYPDSHNYPTLVIDPRGYLHVFYSTHGTKIWYYRSVYPRNATSWTTREEIPDTDMATYHNAFMTQDGSKIFLIYRKSLRQGDGTNPAYEPQYVVKLVYNSGTNHYDFSYNRILIDPIYPGIPGTDHWQTVYVRAAKYRLLPTEGIHLVYAIHKDHNDHFNPLFYSFFNFADENLYKPGPVTPDNLLGSKVNRLNIQNASTEVFSYNNGSPNYDDGQMPPDGWTGTNAPGSYALVTQDSSGYPIVLHALWDSSQKLNYAHEKLWNGSAWVDKDLSYLGSIHNIFSADFLTGNTLTFVARRWGTAAGYDYVFASDDGANFMERTRIFKANPSAEYYGGPAEIISNPHPEIQGIEVTSAVPYTEFGDYQYSPKAVGIHNAYGDTLFGQSPSCSNYYLKYIWSGKPYFVYPQTVPCDNYSLGSNTSVEFPGSNAEFYSPLIAAKPGTDYQLSYEVKTEDLTLTDPSKKPGSIWAAEFNNLARESNLLTQNRIKKGDENANMTFSAPGTKDWTSQVYIFTTDPSTAYIRLRLMLSGGSEAKGRVYFRNISLVPVTTCANLVSYSVSPNPLNGGQTATVQCNFGKILDCLVVSGGWTNCTWVGWTGTSTANFSCTAPSPGTTTDYKNFCRTFSTTNCTWEPLYCAAGSYTVNVAPAPIPSEWISFCDSRFARSGSVGSVTQADYQGCYIQLNSGGTVTTTHYSKSISIEYWDFSLGSPMYVYIDDNPVATINTNQYNCGDGGCKKTWTSSQLTLGSHTLKVVGNSGDYGTQIVQAYFAGSP